jgi:hypothetical protein
MTQWPACMSSKQCNACKKLCNACSACMISKQCNGLNVLCRMQSTPPGDRRMAVQVLQVLYKGLQCFLDCHRKRLREWFAMLVSGVQSDQACLRKIGATPTKLGNA